MKDTALEEMIYATAQKVFSDLSASEGDVVFDHVLWEEITKAGFPIALPDEERGGLGFSAAEAFTAVRVAAAHAVAVPLGETLLANWLLGLANLPLEAGACGISLSADMSQARQMPFGRALCALIVVEPAPNGSELKLYRPDMGGGELGCNIADEPRDGLPANLGDPGAVRALPVSPDTVLAAMAMLRAVQSAAVIERVLTVSLSYCNDREQFGRSLSKFQAIQHQLAQLAAESSAATMAADMALAAFDQIVASPDAFRTLAAAAKIRTAEAATHASAIAHQVHGAIGFSREYCLHPLTRRLWSWRDEDGSEAYWADRLGREIAAQQVGGFWPHLTNMDVMEGSH